MKSAALPRSFSQTPVASNSLCVLMPSTVLETSNSGTLQLISLCVCDIFHVVFLWLAHIMYHKFILFQGVIVVVIFVS